MDSPGTQLSSSDEGSDTQSRYWYQNQYSAVIALSLVLTNPLVVRLFCEHHDDLLLEYPSGKFAGIQVKTRDHTLEVFKTSDDEVIRAIKWFVKLESDFPDWFVHFIFATNHGVLRRNSSASLWRIIDLAQKHQVGDEVHRDMRTLINNVRKKPRKNQTKRSGKSPSHAPLAIPNGDENNPPDELDVSQKDDEFVVKVLAKTKIQEMPKIGDMEEYLAGRVTKVPGFETISRPIARKIANRLTERMNRAGRRDHGFKRDLIFGQHSADSEVDIILKGKTILPSHVTEVLSEFQSTGGALLVSTHSNPLEILSSGSKNITKKAAKGLISDDNISLALDHKASAEVLVTEWRRKFGKGKVTEHIAHLRTLVLTQCQEAYDNTKRTDREFGEDMLKELRERLGRLQQEEKSDAFPIRYEQLLGVVWMLTEECPVWWSEKFDLNEEVSP